MSDCGLGYYSNVCDFDFEELPKGSLVADIGTGQGCRFATELKKERPDVEVLSTSAHHFGNAIKPKDDLVQAILPGLPIRDEAVDCMISVNAWPYYSRREDFAASLIDANRVLKPGGFAIFAAAIVDYGRGDITMQDLKDIPNVNVSLVPLTSTAKSNYIGPVQDLIRIDKPLY